MTQWIYYSTILATLLIAYTLVLRRNLQGAALVRIRWLGMLTAVFMFLIVCGICATFLFTHEAFDGEDVSRYQWIPRNTIWAILLGIMGPYAISALLIAFADPIAWALSRQPKMRYLHYKSVRHGKRMRREIKPRHVKKLLAFEENMKTALSRREAIHEEISRLSETDSDARKHTRAISELSRYAEELDEWVKKNKLPRHVTAQAEHLGIEPTPAAALAHLQDLEAKQNEVLRELRARIKEAQRHSYEAKRRTLALEGISVLTDDGTHIGNTRSAPPPSRSNATDHRLRRLRNRRRGHRK